MLIKQITNRYLDGLYCSRMSGCGYDDKSTTSPRSVFINEIKKAAAEGLSHEDACELLLATINLDKEDFLFVLRTVPDFQAFKQALDVFKLKASSNTPECLLNIALSGGLSRVKSENLLCYNNLYQSILARSEQAMPHAKNIIDAINALESYDFMMSMICSKETIGMAVLIGLGIIFNKPKIVALTAGGALLAGSMACCRFFKENESVSNDMSDSQLELTRN